MDRHHKGQVIKDLSFFVLLDNIAIKILNSACLRIKVLL